MNKNWNPFSGELERLSFHENPIVLVNRPQPDRLGQAVAPDQVGQAMAGIRALLLEAGHTGFPGRCTLVCCWSWRTESFRSGDDLGQYKRHPGIARLQVSVLCTFQLWNPFCYVGNICCTRECCLVLSIKCCQERLLLLENGYKIALQKQTFLNDAKQIVTILVMVKQKHSLN